MAPDETAVPVKIALRAPTGDDLGVGSGVPSGPSGEWRVFAIRSDILELDVYYESEVSKVLSLGDWDALPEHGLQAIVALGGIWKGADEYVIEGGQTKYGSYLSDLAYFEIENAARAAR